MPYTLKTQQISVKDPDSGEYIGVDVLTEQTKEGLITELQDEGNTQVARINQAAVDVQSAVDQAETEAQQLISSTQSSLNVFETQKDTIAQTIASMAELGTDTTLTTAGMAADAKATGDEFSNVKNAISELNNALSDIAPSVSKEVTQTINSSEFTFLGNKTIGTNGELYDNDQYRAYYYSFDKPGTFTINNFGNSTYGFIALFDGTPETWTFIERKYSGVTPSSPISFAVIAGQSVFISVNLYSETINFNVFYTFSETVQPSLFRHSMKIAWFGDSISQLQLLPHRVAEYMANTVYDCSFAGSALTYGSPRYGGMSVLSISGQIATGNYSALEESIDDQEADGIDVTQKRINAATLESLNFATDVTDVVILAGTNDLNNDYVTMSSDLTAFKTGVQQIISNFNNAYPNARLYFISNPYRGDITPSNPDKHGHSLVDIVSAIKEVCTNNNIPFYDLYHNSGINSYTVGYYLMNDQLHQNERGDILLAQKCAKWLDAN